MHPNPGVVMKGLPVKTKLLASCFVAASLLAPLALRAADGDTDRSKPVVFVKDSVITTKVKTKLAADKVKTLAQIHVDTDANGLVVLSGFARDKEGADTAVSIARATEGVTSVRNDIKIKKDD
jgi:hyperosmotically inducible protein